MKADREQSESSRIEIETLKTAAAGRWQDILSHFGIDQSILDGKHHPCPRCGGKDRFRLIDSDAGAVLCNQCFSSGNGDGIAAIQWLCGCDFQDAVNRIADYLGITSDGRHNSAHLTPFGPHGASVLRSHAIAIRYWQVTMILLCEILKRGSLSALSEKTPMFPKSTLHSCET